MNERFRNYGLWVSIFALLGLFLTDLNVRPDNYSQYVDIVLCILVTAGIISNPTDGKFYFDTSKKDKSLEQPKEDLKKKDKK